MRLRSHCFIPVLLVLSSASCGDDLPGASDARAVDGSAPADAATPDGPTPDATLADAARPDAAPADASPPDGMPPDAGPADAGPGQSCPDPADPNVVRHQYVINRLLVPNSPAEAQIYGLDIDGSQPIRVDNAFGALQATIASQVGVDMQATSDAFVLGGVSLQLLDVLTTSLLDAPATELAVLYGEDVDGDLTDNFSGSETFAIRADSPVDNSVCGPIATSQLDLGPGSLTVENTGFGASPISLPLVGARVVGQIDANGIMSGIIGGAVTEADINGTLIPSMWATVDQTVSADCQGVFPNCCTPGSTGETLLGLFNTDNDCIVTLAEVQNNALVQSLLAPDLDLFNNGVFDPNQDGINDSLSVGMGFTAVGASFPPP